MSNGTWKLNVYPAHVADWTPEMPFTTANVLFHAWSFDGESYTYRPPVAKPENSVLLTMPQQPVTIGFTGTAIFTSVDLSNYTGSATLSISNDAPFSNGTASLTHSDPAGAGFWQWTGSLTPDTFYQFSMQITVDGVAYLSPDPEMIVEDADPDP